MAALPTVIEQIRSYLKQPSASVITGAISKSETVIKDAASAIEEFAAQHEMSLDGVAFVAIGSVGRLEALDSSDLDLIPIYMTLADSARIEPLMLEIRAHIAKTIGIKVSKGEDLTKGIILEELTDPETIGGAKDDSSHLTKRVLILTEGRQVCGNLQLREIRRRILSAYGSAERTSGRHVLSLCNDIARYYRTVCIEYKAKVDADGKDWCTRNVKLRHSRKIWYFSNIISIVVLAERHPRGRADFEDGLLSLFEIPPVGRLTDALGNEHAIEVGRLLENYSLFLTFMAKGDNRIALAAIEHKDRYDFGEGNPFPAMKLNSDVIHNYIVTIVDGLRPATRRRVFDWFLM